MNNETQAVIEVAKTTGKIVDAASGLGGFVKQVFGSLLEDSVGLFADKLKMYRLERMYELQSKVEANLKRKSILITKPVPPRIGIKLIEEAAVSDSDELQTKWANLLTNAMDPEFAGTIRRNFVSILADIEPLDARILDAVVSNYEKLDTNAKLSSMFERSKIAVAYGLDLNPIETALRNLMRLGLIRAGIITGGVSMGDYPLTIYKDTELFSITTLGLEFHAAVN
jgi:hypothetical protein